MVAVAIAPGRVDTQMQREIREEGRPGHRMTAEDHARFQADYDEGRLVKPEEPAYVLAKLAAGATREISGGFFKYVPRVDRALILTDCRWNAPELAAYQDDGYGFDIPVANRQVSYQ